MKRLLFIIVLALLSVQAIAAPFNWSTFGPTTSRGFYFLPANIAPTPYKEAGVKGYLFIDSTCNCFKISENGAPPVQLSSFVGSGAVSSVFGRVGSIAALQADYDSFFLTLAEGNNAYAETATGNTFTGDQTITGELFLSKATGTPTLRFANNGRLYGTSTTGVQQEFLIPRYIDNSTMMMAGSGGFLLRTSDGTSRLQMSNAGAFTLTSATGFDLGTIGTATAPAADDSDTSVPNTAWSQAEFLDQTEGDTRYAQPASAETISGAWALGASATVTAPAAADNDTSVINSAWAQTEFLTPTEGNTAYAETATGNTFTGNQTITGTLGVGAAPLNGQLEVFGAANTNYTTRQVLALYDTTAMASGVGAGITFGGKYTTAGAYTAWAGIHALKDNATDSNTAGGLIFFTRANGGSSVERMRITSTGAIGIGNGVLPNGEFANTNVAASDSIGTGVVGINWRHLTVGYAAGITNADATASGRNGLLVKTAATDANSQAFRVETGGVARLSVDGTGKTTHGGAISTYGRTANDGEWTNVAYSAGNFTANGTMTWTVDSGDQLAYSYTVIGKTMYLAFTISTTDIGGTANSELRIAMPGGYTSSLRTDGMYVYHDAGAAPVAGVYQTVAGGTYVRLYKPNGVNWTLTSADNTNVYGVLTIPVN